MSKHFLIAAGTRPEVLKLAPVYLALKTNPDFKVTFCLTGQHKELLQGMLSQFDIEPEVNLEVMTENQTLATLTSRIIEKMSALLNELRPDAVIVHGDTTTAMASALAAFYHKCKIVHVEAGLRTNNLQAPWPEEANRQIIGRLATIHLCPTEFAKEVLERENPPSKNIFVTGNTIIDALLAVASKLNDASYAKKFQDAYSFDSRKPFILVTAHRRENFGDGLRRIFESLKLIAQDIGINVIYPVHLNPSVKEFAHSLLGNQKNIYLIPPQEYDSFVYLMKSSRLILTDSGGVQEEALSFSKPVLVMRETTERPEGLRTGSVHLVGSDPTKIIQTIKLVLSEDQNRRIVNPYGDGNAGKRIAVILEKEI